MSRPRRDSDDEHARELARSVERAGRSFEAWARTGGTDTDTARTSTARSGRLTSGYAVAAVNDLGIEEIRAIFPPHECAEACFFLRFIRGEAERRQLIQAQQEAALDALAPLNDEDVGRVYRVIEDELNDGGAYANVTPYPESWRLLRVIQGVRSIRLPDQFVQAHADELTREEQARLENEWRRNAIEAAERAPSGANS